MKIMNCVCVVSRGTVTMILIMIRPNSSAGTAYKSDYILALSISSDQYDLYTPTSRRQVLELRMHVRMGEKGNERRSGTYGHTDIRTMGQWVAALAFLLSVGCRRMLSAMCPLSFSVWGTDPAGH
jgi:hypothetical protein